MMETISKTVPKAAPDARPGGILLIGGPAQRHVSSTPPALGRPALEPANAYDWTFGNRRLLANAQR